MALGVSPKHVQDVKLDHSDNDHFLVLAIEAAERLGWNISLVSETGFTAYTKLSGSSWSEEVTVKIDNGVANIKSECTHSQLTDWGKNKENVEKLVATIEEVKNVLTEDDIETKLSELRQDYISKGEEEVFSERPLTTKGKVTDFFSFFKPAEGYFVSPILLNINIAVFIVMLISGVHILLPENQDLLNWGGKFPAIDT